jgi:hypothetical protein
MLGRQSLSVGVFICVVYQKAVQKVVSGSLGVNMNGSDQGLNNYCYCNNDQTVMTVKYLQDTY